MEHIVTKQKFGRSIAIYILVALFLCFEMALQVAPSVFTTQLMRDFQLGTFGLGMISSVYYYTYTLMQIPAGFLLDRFTIKWVIVTAVLICSLAAYLFATATSISIVVLSRLVMGAGSACAFIAVLTTTEIIFDKKYFALMAGITQMLAAMGAMSGQLIISIIVNTVGWRHTMLLFTVVGIVLSVIIFYFVNIDSTTRFTNTNTQNLINPIKNRQTIIVAVYACLLWAPMATFASLWGVPYLEIVYQLNKSLAVFLTTFMWIGIAIGGPLLGWWSEAIKSRTIPLFLSAALGFLSIYYILFVNKYSLITVAIAILLMGVACAGQALSFALITDTYRGNRLAQAISINNMAVVIAGSIFQPLVGRLIQTHAKNMGNDGITNFTVADYKFGLSVLLCCYAIAALLSLVAIKETLTVDIKKILSGYFKLNNIKA